MRVLAVGGAVDEGSARAALDLARVQRADRVLVFPQTGSDGVLAALRREGRVALERYLDDNARWLIADDLGVPPPARAAPFATLPTLVTDKTPSAADQRLAPHSALVVELLGSLVLLAVPTGARAKDARESAHIVVHGGAEVVAEMSAGRAILCPGDIARGGALLLVDGPPDPRVSMWSLDGMVTEARSLALGATKLTVQGGSP